MNRILYADDCLNILNDADQLPDESVDLIYLDPPFNSNSNYNLPFKGKDKAAEPVEAFTDVWTWKTGDDDEQLRKLHADPRTRSLANIVQFARDEETRTKIRGGVKSSLASYLLNMARRLRAMRRVLKETGSIYLHCDPTAGHYLKLVMDAVFGRKNFRNEIIWKRKQERHNLAKRRMGSVHDTIFWYVKTNKYQYNIQFLPHSDEYLSTYNKKDERGWYSTFPCTNEAGGNRSYEFRGITRAWRFKLSRMEKMYKDGMLVQPRPGSPFRYKKYKDDTLGVKVQDIWDDIPAVRGKERLGYPTQKPLALLKRIIRASSNPDDLILDPFCGCGTTIHAAEELQRRWVGIDISPFSVGLIHERLADNFEYLRKEQITLRGVPHTIHEAHALARHDKFEFEKWVCGHMGAEGMFREPGERGADGGVDGLLKIYPIRIGKKAKEEYAIIQVKGGKVTPDAVKALYATVKHYEVSAGILVCFQEQLRTVENQRSKETFRDTFGEYPVIQGYSVEDLLANRLLDLPTYGAKRAGGALNL